MKKYQRLGFVLFLPLCVLIGFTSCKQETNESERSESTISTTSTNQTVIQTYTMSVNEDASTDQILVTMDPTVDENKNNSALGETTFNGYLLIESISIKNKAGDEVQATDIKKGDQLKVSVKEPVIIARSFPPKIAGESIESISLMK